MAFLWNSAKSIVSSVVDKIYANPIVDRIRELEAELEGLDPDMLANDSDEEGEGRMIGDLFSMAGSGIQAKATAKELGGRKLLQFYGLFKQAISGDAPEQPDPDDSKKDKYKW